MSRGDLLRLVVTYAIALLSATLGWVLLFHSPLFASWVFFYRGLALLAIVTLILIGLLLALRQTSAGRLLGIRDILLMASLLVSVNALFFTHLPVTADRSISVFMLAYLDRADGPLTAGQISDAVVEEYVLQRDAIGRRIDEQIVTGTVVPQGNGYVISDEGRSLVRLYEAIAAAFNLETTNLAP